MLKLNNVVISRGGQKVNGLSVKADKGDLVALIGPNGAGKTTFMNIIATIIEPTAGDVRIDGYDIFNNRKEIREILGKETQLVILREMTKAFEEIRRGDVDKILDYLSKKDIKGEITIVLSLS